jgi:hypothetical protein
MKAIEPGMPGSTVWPGLSRETPWAVFETAWIWQGKNLPALNISERGLFFSDEKAFLETERQNPALGDNHPETILPVEETQAAALTICGGSDVVWASCAMADRRLKRLRAAGRKDAELLAYEDAGYCAYAA